MVELLEVHTASGEPTGIVKSRAAIHADGDWHMAAFVWIFDARGRALLQRRALDKDVWPGFWDASSAGHVQASEPIEEAARRELVEELGLELEPSALIRDGLHHEERSHPNGLVDREHHAVFFARVDRPLEAYAPGPEVTAIAFVDAAALASNAAELAAETMDSASRTVVRQTLRRDELVVYSPAYLARIAERARSYY